MNTFPSFFFDSETWVQPENWEMHQLFLEKKKKLCKIGWIVIQFPFNWTGIFNIEVKKITNSNKILKENCS